MGLTYQRKICSAAFIIFKSFKAHVEVESLQEKWDQATVYNCIHTTAKWHCKEEKLDDPWYDKDHA